MKEKWLVNKEVFDINDRSSDIPSANERLPEAKNRADDHKVFGEFDRGVGFEILRVITSAMASHVISDHI